MADEPENLTLQLLRKMDSRQEAFEARTDRRLDTLAEAVSELAAHSKRHVDNLAELRRAVMFYHASVAGHGVLLTELDERVRHLEKLLGVTNAPKN